jgi:hypothetical protein
VLVGFDKKKKFNQISFRLMGPDGHPRVQIGTCTRLDPGLGSDAPAGQFSNPHSQPTGAKPTWDPPHKCRLPSLIYVGPPLFTPCHIFLNTKAVGCLR